MEKWLDIGGALFALVAALFWFLSAYEKLPPNPVLLGIGTEHRPILSSAEVLRSDEHMRCFAQWAVRAVHGLKVVVRNLSWSDYILGLFGTIRQQS